MDVQEVAIGNWVRIHDLGDDEEEVFYLVDKSTADPARNRISAYSMFAQALLGAKPGQIVSIATLGGEAKVKIVDTGQAKPV